MSHEHFSVLSIKNHVVVVFLEICKNISKNIEDWRRLGYLSFFLTVV